MHRQRRPGSPGRRLSAVQPNLPPTRVTQGPPGHKAPRPPAHSAVRLINVARWDNLAARSRVRRNLGAISRDTWGTHTTRGLSMDPSTVPRSKPDGHWAEGTAPSNRLAPPSGPELGNFRLLVSLRRARPDTWKPRIWETGRWPVRGCPCMLRAGTGVEQASTRHLSPTSPGVWPTGVRCTYAQ